MHVDSILIVYINLSSLSTVEAFRLIFNIIFQVKNKPEKSKINNHTYFVLSVWRTRTAIVPQQVWTLSFAR